MFDFEESKKNIEKINAEIEHGNFVARARGRQHRDNADAAYVTSVRETGKAVGQPKVYEKRIKRILKERGY